MHSTLESIIQELDGVLSQLNNAIPNDEPFGLAHNNWSFPGLSKFELIEEAQSVVDLIKEQGLDEIGAGDARLQDYIRRLKFLRKQTIPNLWSNASQAVPSYLFTIQGLRRALAPALKRDTRTDAVQLEKKLLGQLRGMEARLKLLVPRTETIASMVERIEHASQAADQLPTDLEALSEARQKVEELLAEATKDQTRIQDIKIETNGLETQISACHGEAKSILKLCESAYSAATSVGLAAAFAERSQKLSISMWIWVVGLVASLALGSYFGSKQLLMLSQLLQTPSTSTFAIALNLLLSLLSVGAPVWFAWLSTKQIGQRFRLSEDYAFKASISRAYEGYRREAARIDKDMEAKLLGSALARLDEIPLRLVEPDSHGSPWHELASSEGVKQAIKAVPGFTEQVKALAHKALDAAAFKTTPTLKPEE